MAFLTVWLLGDATNLIGTPVRRFFAVLAWLETEQAVCWHPPETATANTSNPGAVLTRLAPTAIILPSYFVLADIVLVAQCVYYNRLNKRRAALQQQQREEVAEAHEDSPLLRRSSSYRSRDDEETLAENIADKAALQVATNPWVRNTLSLIGVYAVGIISWFISFKAGAWNVGDEVPDISDADDQENPLEILGLVMGYVSAVCYLW